MNSISVSVVSTLVTVTEQFLQSVHQLKANNQPMEQLLASALEHYDRLNMVIRVLKIAYLLASSEGGDRCDDVKGILNTTANNAATTASNAINRIRNQFAASLRN